MIYAAYTPPTLPPPLPSVIKENILFPFASFRTIEIHKTTQRPVHKKTAQLYTL